MADNALQSIQKLLQDLIAPDVRETKVRLESLEKRIDAQFDSVRKENDAKFAGAHSEITALRGEMDANFRSVLSAIGELRANNEVLSMREIATLRERIAVLEAQRPH